MEQNKLSLIIKGNKSFVTEAYKFLISNWCSKKSVRDIRQKLSNNMESKIRHSV